MASNLNIKRCWFHNDHYDIPVNRIQDITEKCTVITSKEIVKIIKLAPALLFFYFSVCPGYYN